MKLFTRKNALLLTAVIILLAAACAFALSREQKPLFVSEPALAPSDERDFMSVSVEATGDLRTVKGSMCLTATNRTGEDLSEIVLRAADLRRAGGKRPVERAVAERNARLLRGADGVSAERRRRGLRKAIL